MKVFVTGAPGFVGLNIISALCEANHEVYALVRSSSNKEYIKKFPVKIVEGDILAPELLEKAMAGVDAVIHCAAMTSGHKKDREKVFLTNVQGTENVVVAAVKSGVKRLIYTSSTATIGIDPVTRIGNETLGVTDFRKSGQYPQSKIEAEEIALGAMKYGIDVIVLNPAEVMGEYDYHFGWGSVIIGLVKKAMPFIPDGGGCFCDAGEVGRAHVAALHMGRSGERYILGGVNIKYRSLYETISSVTNCEVPSVNRVLNDYRILKIVFKIKEMLSVFTGKMPLLDPIRLKTFYRDIYFSSDKAVAELNYKTGSIEDMVNGSFQWYKKNGML